VARAKATVAMANLLPEMGKVLHLYMSGSGISGSLPTRVVGQARLAAAFRIHGPEPRRAIIAKLLVHPRNAIVSSRAGLATRLGTSPSGLPFWRCCPDHHAEGSL
jgi:hypothetical protein